MSGPLLVTGASGTIGTRLAADLAAHGIPLRLLDRRPPPDGPPAGAEFVQADLRDGEAVEKAAAGACAVIHLAGITREGQFAEMVEHNITGTHHVLEAARRQRVPPAIPNAGGRTPVGTPSATSRPTTPTSTPRSDRSPTAGRAAPSPTTNFPHRRTAR